MKNPCNEFTGIAEAVLQAAKRAGADAADCIIGSAQSTEVSALNGDTENIERTESDVLGLRVFSGQSQAIVSSSSLGRAGLEQLAERAMAMAKSAPPDPLAGLADKSMHATSWADLNLNDPKHLSADDLADMAKHCEAAGREVPGVTKSNGASASAGRQRVVLATSTGFMGSYERSGFSTSASLVAGQGASMERDYDYCSSVWFSGLECPQDVGKRAGLRAVKRLNSRKLPSQTASVVFDARVAPGLLMHLSGAANGVSVARGSSFLKDSLGEQIFAKDINVIDDALMPSQPGSKPFDSEGLPTNRRAIIEDGVLTSWFLDCRSARQLGVPPTGHAARSPSSPPTPSPSNLYLKAGEKAVDDLLRDLGKGVIIVELIGMGINQVTGDYSRGAAGFWFENGEIAYPVSEITIAGKLQDMFANLTPANDLEMRGRFNAPTSYVGEMTIAGS